MKRRTFLKNNGLILGGLTLPSIAFDLSIQEGFITKRPPVKERTFISESVETTIVEIKRLIKDEELAWLFENCYPNTLDTTVDFEMINGKPDSFIITGDIDAMWLRDSTAQVWPYLHLISKDNRIKELVKGLINRQTKCVLKDPYANAFYKDLNKESEWKSDQPSPIPGVHERKWEIDSLCYYVRLFNRYYELTNDSSVFDEEWKKATKLIYHTFKTEQRKDGTSPYYFIRETTTMTDAPVLGGKGNPTKPTGMICSMFRPSDDATLFPFLIPSNLFAEKSLRQLSKIYKDVLKDDSFSLACSNFADEIKEGVNKYGIVNHFNFGRIYAYEVDGFGNAVCMDDANVPSLMSLPYLGIVDSNDELYLNTRKFITSEFNPYFFSGNKATGQGSPHTGLNRIWPIGIIQRAITSNDKEEIFACLKTLRNTHANTGFMHESFHQDNPSDFSRKWFAWANTLFGELILQIATQHKDLLLKTYN